MEILSTPDEVPEWLIEAVTFKMAYVNPQYTNMQLGVRISFMLFSLGICIFYLWKMCRQPRHVQITRDQRALVWISISLVLFNDPTYVAAVFKPSLFTSIVSEFWLALFFVLLLQYWLRSVERVKDASHED